MDNCCRTSSPVQLIPCHSNSSIGTSGSRNPIPYEPLKLGINFENSSAISDVTTAVPSADKLGIVLNKIKIIK
ncbi:hypothetical protein D3C80_1533320 [compost metagenome]